MRVRVASECAFGLSTVSTVTSVPRAHTFNARSAIMDATGLVLSVALCTLLLLALYKALPLVHVMRAVARVKGPEFRFPSG